MRQAQAVLLPAAALTLLVPWPPSGNDYWRHVVINGQARVVLSRRAHEYRRAVAGAVAACGRRFGADRLAVTATYRPPDLRPRDLDNAWKQLGDALARAGLFADDSQVDRLVLERGDPDRPAGSVVVRVEQIGS